MSALSLPQRVIIPLVNILTYVSSHLSEQKLFQVICKLSFTLTEKTLSQYETISLVSFIDLYQIKGIVMLVKDMIYYHEAPHGHIHIYVLPSCLLEYASNITEDERLAGEYNIQLNMSSSMLIVVKLTRQTAPWIIFIKSSLLTGKVLSMCPDRMLAGKQYTVESYKYNNAIHTILQKTQSISYISNIYISNEFTKSNRYNMYSLPDDGELIICKPYQQDTGLYCAHGEYQLLLAIFPSGEVRLLLTKKSPNESYITVDSSLFVTDGEYVCHYKDYLVILPSVLLSTLLDAATTNATLHETDRVKVFEYMKLEQFELPTSAVNTKSLEHLTCAKLHLMCFYLFVNWIIPPHKVLYNTESIILERVYTYDVDAMYDRYTQLQYALSQLPDDITTIIGTKTDSEPLKERWLLPTITNSSDATMLDTQSIDTQSVSKPTTTTRGKFESSMFITINQMFSETAPRHNLSKLLLLVSNEMKLPPTCPVILCHILKRDNNLVLIGRIGHISRVEYSINNTHEEEYYSFYNLLITTFKFSDISAKKFCHTLNLLANDLRNCSNMKIITVLLPHQHTIALQNIITIQPIDESLQKYNYKLHSGYFSVSEYIQWAKIMATTSSNDVLLYLDIAAKDSRQYILLCNTINKCIKYHNKVISEQV